MHQSGSEGDARFEAIAKPTVGRLTIASTLHIGGAIVYHTVIIVVPLASPVNYVSHQTILVLDFGSQFTQLIARRLRELSVYSEILPFNTPVEVLAAHAPVGLILSGGPKSVSETRRAALRSARPRLGVPTLGICYGMQLMTHMLGGRVSSAPHREFGHAVVA